jgi:hypothetical protein
MQIAITNRGSNQIQPEIIKQMNNAQRSIWIAVAWFTDREIYNVLITKLKQGVKIRLIALYDDINQEKGIDFDTLSKNGAEVYLTQDGNLLMHHKYCIIDSETVIMGSYNYTKAAQSQRESVIVSKHENQIVREFETEFNDILKEYFGKQHTKKEEECPLTMEWWNGLPQYGNLKHFEHDLKKYNWQHIFMVHLVLWEKGIVVNSDVIGGYSKKYGWKSYFQIYEQEFNTTFSSNLPNINQKELNKIYQVSFLLLSDYGIDSLAPLQEFRNLRELCSNYNPISSLEPLRELKNLQKLDFYENKISSLEPLRELKNLQELGFHKNQISSLEPLRELKNLQELDCSSNQISSLEPLRELKNLQKLDFYENQISSLEPLRELKNLQNLIFSSNKISSLEPLRELKNLQRLYFRSNEISSLEPLRELKNLQNLIFSSNKISSLEPLRELKNLQKLDCASFRFDSSEIEKFKKEHPNCKVD